MGLKHILKKLILGPKTSSSDYVTYLRSLGMTIGDNTVIYSPNYCVIDQTRPWMIEIGNNCLIRANSHITAMIGASSKVCTVMF